MMLTDDLYIIPTKPAENELPMLATCSICGCYVNLAFRDVHAERCTND